MLTLATGDGVTVRGWDEPRVKVRAQLAGRDWQDTDVRLERIGNGVRLVSEFFGPNESRSTRHEFEIWVPRNTNIELESSGGSLAINDVTGEFRGRTGGGAITIANASGFASISTGGGSVHVTDSNLSGVVSTGGGQVLISNVKGGLRGTSGSGPVISGSSGFTRGVVSGATAGGRYNTTTTISGTAYGTNTITSSGSTTNISRSGLDGDMLNGKFEYNYSKAGGNIDIDEAPANARFSTGGGLVYIGASSGFLSVSTGGGDITLPHVGGSVSAWTGSGEIKIALANGDRERSVDVFSGNGRVILELPANLDATFELETAYTETRPPTKIESDFSLTQSESSDWDDSMGTPRKFVRARGSVGSGKGLIRIRVVNGDVVVRRGR